MGDSRRVADQPSATVNEIAAVLRFVGDRADFALGVVFQRDDRDESDVWPPVFERLGVLDPGVERPDFDGIVRTALTDVRDGLAELGYAMRFPAGGPRLVWSAEDARAEQVVARARGLGADAWTWFEGAS